MELKIIWSQFAESQLDEIYNFYESEASYQIALEIVKGIINESQKLIKSPKIGQVEELLKESKIHYRYLIFKNYKIIYSVDKENGYIKITDVFDVRQNPIRIKRTK